MLTDTVKPKPKITPPRKEKSIPTDLFGDAEKKKAPATLGNIFEKTILDTCKEYLRLEVAYIQKNETPTRWIPPNPKTGKPGFLLHIKKTGFDFVGAYKISYIVPTGTILPNSSSALTNLPFWKPIFVEAKTTKENIIACYQESGGITAYQIMQMQWLEAHGLEAYFLWQARSANIVFKITPQQIVNMTMNKKSLTINDCSDNRIPRVAMVRSNNGMYLDFLNLLDD